MRTRKLLRDGASMSIVADTREDEPVKVSARGAFWVISKTSLMRLASSIGCPVDRTKSPLDTILPLDEHFKNTRGKEQKLEIVRRRVTFRDIEVVGAGRTARTRAKSQLGLRESSKSPSNGCPSEARRRIFPAQNSLWATMITARLASCRHSCLRSWIQASWSRIANVGFQRRRCCGSGRGASQ